MAEGTKDIAVKTKLKSMNDTIDKIKSAVAGNIDLRVMRADLNERYLPGLSNSVSCLLPVIWKLMIETTHSYELN